ncbi:hypothetical protein AaE_000719 [Aphanomyces astaci]|uniref:Uncharacterized protein n=1 Tax=Aphanomyces astaci TaxID=112090 RepID=A0A6A5AYM3_APHAT|nr:hypothetical protein AaE_000719 [Aphanomyces astaci]
MESSCSDTQTLYTGALRACGYTPSFSCEDVACLHNNLQWCNSSVCSSALSFAQNLTTECGRQPLNPPMPLQICDTACVGATRLVHGLLTTCITATGGQGDLAACLACQYYQGNRSMLFTHCAIEGVSSPYGAVAGATISRCKIIFPQLLPSFPSAFDDSSSMVVRTDVQSAPVFIVVVIVGMVVAVSVVILVYFQVYTYMLHTYCPFTLNLDFWADSIDSLY